MLAPEDADVESRGSRDSALRCVTRWSPKKTDSYRLREPTTRRWSSDASIGGNGSAKAAHYPLRQRSCQHVSIDSETNESGGRHTKDIIVDVMACMGGERLRRRTALREMIRDRGYYGGQERDWIRDSEEDFEAAGTFSSPSPVFFL